MLTLVHTIAGTPLAGAPLATGGCGALQVLSLPPSGSPFPAGTAVQGRDYPLEYKNSLLDTDWTPLGAIPGDGTTKDLNDVLVGSQRFYRVKQF